MSWQQREMVMVMRNPVLLIHGIDDTDIIFHRMAPYLEQQGWAVHTINLTPNNGAVGLDILAKQVAAYIDKNFAPQQKIDLVGFSMGGIISRYYVQRLGGLDKVDRLVTISSPHHGTWAAHIRRNPGGRQMLPQSDFLDDLNLTVMELGRIHFTSIWTPLDLIIVPASSSQMPVGHEKKLWIGGHAWMVTDRRCLQAVAESLSTPLKSA
ncbi:MAG: triacylglycerol lipase [Oculatellaceae cyanobacterium Prado106]|nr:triacylglycerol lipase [Oculatellaceae cyanobacterium Prado106]